MPDETVWNEGQLLTLINLALLSKDEQWFKELSAKLASIKKAPEMHTKKSEFPSGNRIRLNGTKR